MNISGFPIEDPTQLFGKEIFYVEVQPVDNHKEQTFGGSIGSILKYASVESVQVKQLEFDSTGTGVVINKDTDRINIPMDQSRVSAEAHGTFFDDKEKANAVVTGILTANLEKADELAEDISNARKLLESAINLTNANKK